MHHQERKKCVPHEHCVALAWEERAKRKTQEIPSTLEFLHSQGNLWHVSKISPSPQTTDPLQPQHAADPLRPPGRPWRRSMLRRSRHPIVPFLSSENRITAMRATEEIFRHEMIQQKQSLNMKINHLDANLLVSRHSIKYLLGTLGHCGI